MSLADLLPWDAPPEEAIVLLAALTAVLCAWLVYRTMLYRNPVDSRLRSVAARREALRDGLSAAARRRVRRDQGLGLMRRMINALNLLRSREATKAALRLSRAGWRSRDAVTLYFFLKLCLPFAFGGVALILVYVLPVVDLAAGARTAVALGAVILGAYAPDLFVRNARTKRQQALQKGLPDALDLLVICAEAGQSLDAALKRVAEEVGRFGPEIGDELALTAVELGMMPDRRQALENLNRRTELASIRSIVNTLGQTEKYGTPLAQSLRVLAAEFRQDRMMRAEEKAARLPAILTVPMIGFILPPLFVVLLGPAVLKIMDMFARM